MRRNSGRRWKGKPRKDDTQGDAAFMLARCATAAWRLPRIPAMAVAVPRSQEAREQHTTPLAEQHATPLATQRPAQSRQAEHIERAIGELWSVRAGEQLAMARSKS